MGRIIEKGTIRPDQDYLEALTKIPTPKDKPAVQRLLGLFRYLSPFINNLTGKTEHLRNLIRDDVDWSWTEDHEKELRKEKLHLEEQPICPFYRVGVDIFEYIGNHFI